MGEHPLSYNKFSIVLPVTSGPLNTRVIQFKDAVNSIIRQTYKDWELIIVEDGCLDELPQIADDFAKQDERIKVIHHDGNLQRSKSRNDGMKAATNDWICWMDSDDEYLKTYLEVLNSYMTEDFPGYMCYSYGAIAVRMGYQSVRQAPDLKEEGEGMENFSSGSIGTGSFCFHKSVLDTVGYLPETLSPHKFAELCKEESPKLIEMFGGNYKDGGRDLGNPWGDDYYMFWKITRRFKSKALPIAPYIQFVRRQGFSFQPKRDY